MYHAKDLLNADLGVSDLKLIILMLAHKPITRNVDALRGRRGQYSISVMVMCKVLVLRMVHGSEGVKYWGS